jgi:hypothetical protein
MTSLSNGAFEWFTCMFNLATSSSYYKYNLCLVIFLWWILLFCGIVFERIFFNENFTFVKSKNGKEKEKEKLILAHFLCLNTHMIYHNFYIYLLYWCNVLLNSNAHIETQRPNIVKLTKDIIAHYNYWLYGYQLGLINIYTSIYGKKKASKTKKLNYHHLGFKLQIKTIYFWICLQFRR